MPSKKVQLTAKRTHPRPIVPRPVTQGYNILISIYAEPPFLGSIFRFIKRNNFPFSQFLQFYIFFPDLYII